jgi:hypothetical protein
MHKNARKCNETLSKWCKNKHGASKIMDTLKMYHDATTELRRSTRSRATPEWCGNPVLTIMLLDNNEPANYEEAMMSPDSGKWLEAMKSELGSMSENQV